jgi:hypothetical protein
MYLLNPAVFVAGLTNILLLPDIIVSAVLLLVLNIKFTNDPEGDGTDADKCADADVYDLPTNIIDPDASVIVKKLPALSINVWSPVNVLDPVVAKLPVLIVPPPPNELVGTNEVLPLALPTQTYPSCKDALNVLSTFNDALSILKLELEDAKLISPFKSPAGKFNPLKVTRLPLTIKLLADAIVWSPVNILLPVVAKNELLTY